MLVWSKAGRLAILAVFALVFGAVVLAPLAVLALAAVADGWNGVLPAALTTRHLRGAITGEDQASLLVSVQTAAVAGLFAVVLGGWAALAVASPGSTAPPWLRRVTSAVFSLGVAVPSVVVGLGLLVAFSRPPLLLNGTRWIVLVAHGVLVVSFAYGTVAAALARTDPAHAEIAASLGASPARVLLRVRLPLLVPALSAAASLSVALSMGEVGATIMVYPPDWRTLPVTIFTLTDRGQTFAAAASTVILLATTLVVLVTLGRFTGARRAGARSGVISRT